jgi:hypothetical protein
MHSIHSAMSLQQPVIKENIMVLGNLQNDDSMSICK